jgi:hypothetical protein
MCITEPVVVATAATERRSGSEVLLLDRAIGVLSTEYVELTGGPPRVSAI